MLIVNCDSQDCEISGLPNLGTETVHHLGREEFTIAGWLNILSSNNTGQLPFRRDQLIFQYEVTAALYERAKLQET